MATPESPSRGVDTLAMHEYGSDAGRLLGLNYRWFAYEQLTDRPMDFYKIAYEALAIDPGSSVLDVGCASGLGIEGFYRDFDHQGPVVGLDIVNEPYLLHKRVRAATTKERNDMNFVQASGDNMPFEDSSFDNTLAIFSLYHIIYPRNAIAEIQRVTKPGGHIAIATSALGNKPWHRFFEERIGNYLRVNSPDEALRNVQVPPIFANRFEASEAKHILPEYFNVIDIIQQFDGYKRR